MPRRQAQRATIRRGTRGARGAEVQEGAKGARVASNWLPPAIYDRFWACVHYRQDPAAMGTN